MKVIVLAGGPDAEREVSIMSGREIAAALRKLGRYEVDYREIDRLQPGDLAAMKGDVVFPALHGPWGEGGPLQALLEADGRPFVGAGSTAAAAAMDKARTKEIARELGIATPDWQVLRSVDEPLETVQPPLVLKPLDDGSSVDVVICRDLPSVRRERERLLGRRTRLLVERFIPGRELTVGVIGDEVGSVIEIKPASEFYDYEAKYERDDTGYVVGPELPPGMTEALGEASLRLFRALGVRDLARVDFRVDEVSDPANPSWWMLELNTMPGFTSHSLVPMGAAAGGVPMPELCGRLVEFALERGSPSLHSSRGAPSGRK
ncbi:MAG: D-alanine--D-alanine ligase [Phycisphaerales bacterium]